MENAASVGLPREAEGTLRKRREFGQVLRRRRKDGKLGSTWSVRYRDLDGRERWEAIGPGPKGYKLAVRRLAEIRVALVEEDVTGRRPITPITLLDFWPTLEAALRGRRHYTADSLAAAAPRFRVAAAWLGDRTLASIGPAEVADFLGHLRSERGVSAATVNRYASFLKVAFEEAVERGHAERNPAAGVKRAPEPAKEIPLLSRADLDRILAACPSEITPAVALLAETGCRRGEILSLRWQDADLGRGVILIRAEISKTKRGREVPLTPKAVEVLERLRAGAGPVRMLREDPIFPGLAGTGRNRFSQAFRRAARRAGYKVRLHDLRHTVGSTLHRAGVSIADVGRVLGHRSLASTMRYARHAPGGAEEQAIRKLAEAWGETPTDGAAAGGEPGIRRGIA